MNKLCRITVDAGPGVEHTVDRSSVQSHLVGIVLTYGSVVIHKALWGHIELLDLVYRPLKGHYRYIKD